MIPNQMIYWVIGIFLLLSVPFTECTKKVQELMTDDEISNLFQTTRDQIPEYEMVAIDYSLRTSSTSQDFVIKFRAFDQDVQAYLDPTDGILVGEDTPVWIARDREGEIQYRRLKRGIMKEVFGIYQSFSDRAALVVNSRKGRDLRFHGTIQNLTVIPLPDRVARELKEIEERERDLSPTNYVPTRSTRHIVFRLNTGVNQTATAQQSNESLEENSGDTLKENYVNALNHSNKYMVFPTILVTTDFNVNARSLKGDLSAFYDQIIYQLAFWNGVDLRFRHLKNPGVRLRIAGLVIGVGRSATHYIKNNMYKEGVDAYSAINEMGTYWSQVRKDGEFPSASFHIVSTVTNLKLLAQGKLGSKRLLRGLARLSSICIKAHGKRYPSMLFRDDLGFDGINAAVHELGHILGARHDNDIDGCRPSEGYLMSPIARQTLNNLKWSKCSLESIARLLRTRTCADNPNEYYPSGEPLGRVLPGAVVTADEQCRARGFPAACELEKTD